MRNVPARAAVSDGAVTGCQRMARPLRRVQVRPPSVSAVSSWPEAQWRRAPDVGKLVGEHDAFCGLLRAAGAEVLVADGDPDGLLDAIYVFDAAIICDRGA